MQSLSSRRLVVMAACLMPLSAVADDAVVQLNPLVVTPTLSTQTVDESLSSVTVIEREALDRQQPREFSDVLRGQPGFDFISNGSFGKNTSVYTRGTGSESTVLLIDGIRIRSATSGDAPWRFIPPQLLDRVELVRGPRGTLYGADAVGGVVQGFTPDGRDGDRHWIQGGAGSHGSHEYGGGFAGSSGGTSWSLGANHFHTAGVPVREDGDDKGFYNTSAVGRLTHAFDNGLELGVLGFRAQGHTEFDGGNTDFLAQTVGATATIPVTQNWVSQLQLSEGRTEEETIQGGSQSVFDTRTRTARLETTVFQGGNELIFGGEFMRDDADASSELLGYEELDETRRDNRAVFGQYLVGAGEADVQFSGRFDSNEAFGDHATGSVAMGQRLDASHRVRLSYGTAFRAPTFNDLYTPMTPFNFEGNPDLSPEKSQTAELGFRGQYQNSFWDVALFQTHVEDLIETRDDNGVDRPQNVDRARIQGVEFSSGVSLGQWEVGARGTLMEPIDRDTGNRLRRRSATSARLDVDRFVGDFSIGASGVAQGDRYNDSDNEERLSGFALMNLRAGWEFARNWSAQMTIDNVFDKDYVTARNSFSEFDYKNAGRSAFLSVRYGNR